jgi:hypothetical protein
MERITLSDKQGGVLAALEYAAELPTVALSERRYPC